MSNSLPEHCEHEPCGFNQRREYCIEPLDEKRELGRYLADEIDALLYEGTEYSHEGISHEYNDDIHATARRLEIISATDFYQEHEQYSKAVHATQNTTRSRMHLEKHTIELERLVSPAQEAYSITFRAQDLDTFTEKETVQYNLYFGVGESAYNGQTTFDECVLLVGLPELRSRWVKDRQMSNYDYEQLFDLLWKVHQVHGLEGASNARSEDWLNQLDW